MDLSTAGETFTTKVSSVLGRDTKTYGKQYLFDRREDTCWNSDQGSPQWIYLHFGTTKSITGITVQFQGGFAATEIQLQAKEQDSDFVTHCTFYPKDSNESQTFTCDRELESDSVRLLLPSSSDMFGRVIVYDLRILGK